MNRSIKVSASLLGILAIGLAICSVTGLVEFTYPKVVANEPLLHPRKVREFDGTNMVLESGEIIALLPRYSSERTTEEIYVDISNQVSRSDYEVDVDRKNGDCVEVYVRRLRKFRDTVPPITIPLIRETVGRKYRTAVAFGTYLSTNRQDGAANGSQPIRSETNGTSSAADSRR